MYRTASRELSCRVAGKEYAQYHGATVSVMTVWRGFVLFVSGLCVASAATACHNGDRIPIDGSCKSYMECESGNLVEKSCGLLESFDAKTLSCRWSYHVDCVEKSKECEDGKLYSHPDSCKLYYACRAGRLVLQFCPILEVFSPERGECKWGLSCNKTECVADESRSVPGDCRSYDECSSGAWKRHSCLIGANYNPVTSKCEIGGCRQCADGDRAPGAACNTFQYCEYGTWHDDHCGLFRRYDPVKKSCVWWFQYTCPKAVTFNLKENCDEGSTRAEQDCGKYSICQSGNWVQQTCPDGYLFDSVSENCKQAAEARCKYCAEDTPDPEDCRYYYTCELGKSVRKKCPLLKKWDGVSKTCVLSWKANCFPGESCTGGSRPTQDCKVYEECLGGHYYKRSCGFSRVYDAAKQKCVWVWPWSTCDASYLAPECADGDRKILSCDQYVQCENGIWYIRKCQEGYTFKNGECVQGECSVVMKDCARYVVNDIEIECVPGEFFDEEKRVCGVGSCERAKRALSDCTEGERIAIKDECKKYQVCKGGQLVEETCSDCMNFEPTEKKCKFVFDYACGEPTQPTTPSTQPTTPSTQPTTPSTQPTTPSTKPTSQPTEPTSHPTEPTSQPTEPTSQPTEPTSHATDPSTQPTQPSTQPTQPTSPSTEPPTTTPAPECVDGQRKPNLDDCQKYFECSSGHWKPDSCILWRKFDSIDLKCVNWGARCAK